MLYGIFFCFNLPPAPLHKGEIEVLKKRTFFPSCLFLLERTINEQSRKQNKMEMGDYRTDSHVGGGILHPSLKIIGFFQRFFRIKPFLCRKKGQES